MVPFWPPSQKNPETWVKFVESSVKIMESFWKMGISLSKSWQNRLTNMGSLFSCKCVRVLWRSWLHIVKLNDWTSVTAIVNFCLMTCRLCYEYRRTQRCQSSQSYSGLIIVFMHTWSSSTCIVHKSLRWNSVSALKNVRAGNKITTGNRNKLQNAPQPCLGYSPLTSAIIVSPNIMYMRDFVCE